MANQLPIPSTPNQPPKRECAVSEKECEQKRKIDNDSMMQQIKLHILDLKLWIVCSIVILLASSGGTFICTAKEAGKVEERVNTIQQRVESQGQIIDSLREEIWKIMGVGRYRSTNNERNEADDSTNVSNGRSSNRPTMAP